MRSLPGTGPRRPVESEVKRSGYASDRTISGTRPGRNSWTVSTDSATSAARELRDIVSGSAVGVPRPSRVALTVTPSTVGAPYRERSPVIRMKIGKASGANCLASRAREPGQEDPLRAARAAAGRAAAPRPTRCPTPRSPGRTSSCRCRSRSAPRRTARGPRGPAASFTTCRAVLPSHVDGGEHGAIGAEEARSGVEDAALVQATGGAAGTGSPSRRGRGSRRAPRCA